MFLQNIQKGENKIKRYKKVESERFERIQNWRYYEMEQRIDGEKLNVEMKKVQEGWG